MSTKGQKTVTIRIPLEIWKQCAREADKGNRSLNAEITQRLRNSFERPYAMDDATLVGLLRALVRGDIQINEEGLDRLLRDLTGSFDLADDGKTVAITTTGKTFEETLYPDDKE